MEAPRILATFLVAGFCTLFVVGFFLCPQLDESREDFRNSWYRRHCREAQKTLIETPAELRLSQWPVVGRIPPNLVVIDMPTFDDSQLPLRATLIDPNGEIVRTFVLRDNNAPLSDGAKDYTIESANIYLAKVKFHRRREWMIFISVWLTSTGLLTWQFLKKPSVDGVRHE